MLKPLFVFGTRPEAIKIAPIVAECKARSGEIHPLICVTGQHREMVDSIIRYFNLTADFDLNLMRPNQTLSGLSAACLQEMDGVVQSTKPDCVVAQGDTTTVLAASIVAFYHRIPFVHVEAGLRTNNYGAPWPEEFNRRVADLAAALYCAPTRAAADQLRSEGISASKIRVTGNTVIDALFSTISRERNNQSSWNRKYEFLGSLPVVLITGHRRESFGEGFQNICQAVRRLAVRFPDVRFVYPVHLNPNVREPVYRALDGIANVHLLPPLDYPEFVWLMDRAYLILTDSGGIQEEAPSLGKPVMVMRDTTERPEAVECGAARLVGTALDSIFSNVERMLSNRQEYETCQVGVSPFGDGKAAGRIVDWMLERPWLTRVAKA